MKKEKEWFASWFDSVYYHKLYDHRDDAEAERFIDHLVEGLNMRPASYVLDLACGKGRHSKYLFEHGMDVTGVDLSLESIEFAQQWEEPGLEFYTHDMRASFRMNYYDYIFNLFTSFGYFQTEREHLKVLESIHKGLKVNGTFVMDFLNERYVSNRLIEEETIDKNGLIFQINRKIEHGFIIKNITFRDDDQDYNYEERVRAFKLEELIALFQRVGLNVQSIHGDYELGDFNIETSSRLILVAQKV